MQKNKILLSAKTIDGEVRIVQQNEECKPDNYLEFGSGWFEMPNFYKDITINFKVSTLKRKNKEGVNMLVFDFVCMKDKSQESINKHSEDFNAIIKKLTNLAILMTKQMSLEEHKNYSFMIRQAEKWLLNLNKFEERLKNA